jgi:hypothetical protein
MLSKLISAIFLLFLIYINLYASESEQYLNFCKIYNPKKGIEYETHTKISIDFCEYYLEKCNLKYANKCKAKMDAYQGLYNTNRALAQMHILYKDNFDRRN